MTYKYINIHMVGADPITARNAEISHSGDFIIVENDRTEWRFNIDQVKYISISKEENQ